MSTLKTHNLQSPDAGSVNIAMTPNAGMVVTGISTFNNKVLLGTDTEGVANASKFTIADTGHCGMTVRSGTSHDGQLAFSDGTSGDDEFRGQIRYNHADNYLSLVTNATEKLRITSDGRIGINQDTPRALLSLGPDLAAQKMLLYDNDGGTNEKYGVGIQSNELRQFAGGSAILSFGHISSSDGSTYSEKLRITSTGKLLLGHSSSTSVGVGAAYDMPLQVIGNSYDTAGIVAARYAADANGPTLHFVKSRNATKGSQTIVQVNDTLGFIRWYGSDGTDTTNAAAMIGGYCDATPASNKIPGRLSFWTTDTLTYPRERLRITSSGIVQFRENAGSYTNTVQSHAGEAGFITHYTARTTSGADLYRRMLDIASGGANPHGSSIRFLTSDDNTNPATCVERMRILNDGGVFIGQKTHNQRYPHIESPALLTVQNGARVDTTANVFVAPKGGFCDHARYELEQKLISISNSNLGICQARNGQALGINESRSSWSYFANLPNYLLGHAATDNINNSNFTLTLYADMTVFLLRSSGWNSVNLTGWNLIESDTDIDPAAGGTRLYVKSLAAGSYTNFDNDSAMYFFVL